eukprot:8581857-Prorocentrum_lima.AAC.1
MLEYQREQWDCMALQEVVMGPLKSNLMSNHVLYRAVEDRKRTVGILLHKRWEHAVIGVIRASPYALGLDIRLNY